MSAVNPQPAIAWADVEQTLVDWAQDMTGLVAVWAEEDGPQPDRPFVVLDWLVSPTAIGDDYFAQEEVTETSEIDQLLTGVRAATLTVKIETAVTRAGENAQHYADVLATSLIMESVRERYFAPYRMATWGSTPLTKGAFVEDAKAVGHAGFDVRLGFAAGTGKSSERAGYITGASVTGTMTAPALTATLSITS